MSGEVEKCPILHVRPKFDVFTLVCAGCLLVTLLILTARENVKSISFDIWQHKYLLAFKPCENCYSLHENMANTNSIVVAAIDSEYFAIIFAKRDRCCRGRHL